PYTTLFRSVLLASAQPDAHLLVGKPLEVECDAHAVGSGAPEKSVQLHVFILPSGRSVHGGAPAGRQRRTFLLHPRTPAARPARGGQTNRHAGQACPSSRASPAPEVARTAQPAPPPPDRRRP